MTVFIIILSNVILTVLGFTIGKLHERTDWIEREILEKLP